MRIPCHHKVAVKSNKYSVGVFFSVVVLATGMLFSPAVISHFKVSPAWTKANEKSSCQKKNA